MDVRARALELALRADICARENVLLERVVAPADAAVAHEEEARLRENGLEADADRALQLLSKAAFLQPKDAELFARRGEVCLRLGDLKSGLSNLQHALSLRPESAALRRKVAMVHDAIGCMHLESGDCVRALGAFNAALELEKRVGLLWMHRALVLTEQGALVRALEDLGAYIDLERNDVDARVLRGKIYWRLSQMDEAAKDFADCKRLDPSHPEVKLFEGAIAVEARAESASASRLMLTGQFEAALKVINVSLRSNPHALQPILWAASAARRLGRLDEAVSYLDQAQMGDLGLRDQAAVRKERALVLNDRAVRIIRDGGSLTVAQRRLEEAIALWKAGGVLHVHRGDCLRMRGHLDACVQEYQEARRLGEDVNSRLAFVHYLCGQELFNKQSYAEAEAEFTQAIAAHGVVAEYYSNRGLARACQKRISHAFEDFKAALRLDPANQRARAWLAKYPADSRQPAAHTQSAPQLAGSKGPLAQLPSASLRPGHHRAGTAPSRARRPRR